MTKNQRGREGGREREECMVNERWKQKKNPEANQDRRRMCVADACEKE